MRLICRGAEADLLLGKWAGEPAVYKMRKPLKYRLKLLDKTIRAHRTAHEAQTMHQAKAAGVRTPYIYYVDPTAALLVMEFVEGERMKSLLEKKSVQTESLCRSFGEAVARLHRGGIMHGDLTTSNVIVNSEGIVFIDFGLSLYSSRLEDHAVDLRLIKETLTSGHSTVSSKAFAAILEGYETVVGARQLDNVKRKLVEIERRGRYAMVE